MRRRTFLIYATLGILAITASAMLYGDAFPLTGGFVFGFIAILSGAIAYLTPSKSGYSRDISVHADPSKIRHLLDEGRRRSIAQDLAPIPGAGQFYLGRHGEGAVLLSSLVISVVAILASGPPGEVEDPVLFAMGFGLAILSSAISFLSVYRAHDRADLDSEAWSLPGRHVRRRRGWLNVLTIAAIAWTVLMAMCHMLSDAGGTGMAVCVAAAMVACVVRSTLT